MLCDVAKYSVSTTFFRLSGRAKFHHDSRWSIKLSRDHFIFIHEILASNMNDDHRRLYNVIKLQNDIREDGVLVSSSMALMIRKIMCKTHSDSTREFIKH